MQDPGLYLSKVKVTLLGQTSRVGSSFCVWPVTLSSMMGFQSNLAPVIITARQHVTCKSQVAASEVKVTMCSLPQRSRSFLDGFRNHFTEMLTTMRQCDTQVGSSKVKVTFRGQR